MTLYRSCFAAAILTPMTLCAAVANFSGGDGTSSIDQYTGLAGDGWLEPWVFALSQGSNVVGTSNSAPLAIGTADYLSVAHTNTHTGNTGQQVSIRRQWATAGATDSTTYSMLFRLDGSSGFDGLTTLNPLGTTTGAEYIGFGDAAAVTNTNIDVHSWALRLLATTPNTGSGGTTTGPTVLTWQHNAGGVDQTMVQTTSSNMRSTGYFANLADWIGDTFKIDVTASPSSGTYDLSIQNLTDSTGVSLNDLGFDLDAGNTLGGTFFINSRDHGNSAESPDPTLAFSVDSISINVPEPVSLSLFAVAGLVLLRRRGM